MASNNKSSDDSLKSSDGSSTDPPGIRRFSYKDLSESFVCEKFLPPLTNEDMICRNLRSKAAMIY